MCLLRFYRFLEISAAPLARSSAVTCVVQVRVPVASRSHVDQSAVVTLNREQLKHTRKPDSKVLTSGCRVELLSWSDLNLLRRFIIALNVSELVNNLPHRQTLKTGDQTDHRLLYFRTFKSI